MRNSVLVFTLLIFCNGVFASGAVTGKIVGINIKENGYVFVSLDVAHSNPDGCSDSNHVVFAHDHIAKREMLSVALTAMTTKSVTWHYVSGCFTYGDKRYPIAINTSISQ